MYSIKWNAQELFVKHILVEFILVSYKPFDTKWKSIMELYETYPERINFFRYNALTWN